MKGLRYWFSYGFLALVVALTLAVFCIQISAIASWNRSHKDLADKDSPLATMGDTTVTLLALVIAGGAYVLPNLGERRSQNHRVVELLLNFDDVHFRNTRGEAWKARSKWYLLPEKEREEWRRELIGGMVPVAAENGIAPLRKLPKRTKDASEVVDLIDHRWAVYQMLNLYQALAFFECDDEDLRRVGLYYAYWRGFLYDVIGAYEMAYDRELNAEEKRMLPREEWRVAFERLDKRMCLPPYDKRHDPQMREYLKRM